MTLPEDILSFRRLLYSEVDSHVQEIGYTEVLSSNCVPLLYALKILGLRGLSNAFVDNSLLPERYDKSGSSVFLGLAEQINSVQNNSLCILIMS